MSIYVSRYPTGKAVDDQLDQAGAANERAAEALQKAGEALTHAERLSGEAAAAAAAASQAMTVAQNAQAAANSKVDSNGVAAIISGRFLIGSTDFTAAALPVGAWGGVYR